MALLGAVRACCVLLRCQHAAVRVEKSYQAAADDLMAGARRMVSIIRDEKAIWASVLPR
jgi:hypothetical protein